MTGYGSLQKATTNYREPYLGRVFHSQSFGSNAAPDSYLQNPREALNCARRAQVRKLFASRVWGVLLSTTWICCLFCATCVGIGDGALGNVLAMFSMMQWREGVGALQ